MKKISFLITLFVLVAFASGAMAIRKPEPEPAPGAAESTTPEKPTMEKMEKMEKFSGLIKKVDEKGKTIVVKGKRMREEKILTFAVDDRTKIIKGGATTVFGILKKEMEVSIEYKKEMDKLIAIVIRVFVGKDAPKKM